MFKNTASKLAIFAFDTTTGLPKTGDAANLTCYVSKDYGAVTVLGDTSATEMDATNAKGWYLFDLAQAETNADSILFTGKSSTANISLVGQLVFTTPPTFTSLVVGNLDATVSSRMATYTQPTGFLAATFPSGTIANTTNITAGTITTVTTVITATNLTNAPTAGDLTATMKTSVTTAATASTPTISTLGASTITAASIASNAITAAKVAADAIGASQLAADAVTEIQAGLATPTNITAGTITTVTNLTNAPTAGDLTATMKTSVTTAATAATPVAASVTGNVGGNVTGSVGSVVGAVGSVTGLTASNVGAIKTQTDKLAFTVTNQIDANVLDWKSATAPAMTGDAFARLGAPAGASVSVDIAAIKTDTSAIGAGFLASPISGLKSQQLALKIADGNYGGGYPTGWTANVPVTDLDPGGGTGMTVDIWSPPSGPLSTSVQAIAIHTPGTGYKLGAALNIDTIGDGACYFSLISADDINQAVDTIKAKTDGINFDSGIIRASLSAAERNALSDAWTTRNIAGGSSTGRTNGQAMATLRNKVTILAGVLTVYDTDDTTVLFSGPVTTAAGNPLASFDPT